MLVFLTTRDIYSHKQPSGWMVIYYCGDCGASVGTHPDTTIPLGLMATARTRYLRARAHSAFDTIWRCGYMTRERAIRWAAQQLAIVEEFHISTLSDTNLELLTKIATTYINNKARYNLERQQELTEQRRGKDARRISANNTRHAKRRRKKR